MKKMVLVMLVCCCPLFAQDAITVKAIEGAKLLHSAARDPDSFKIGRAWIMRSEKYGDAICYDYYARNGFGGMNHSGADYAPHTKKDVVNGKYILDAEADQSFEFASRCGERAIKHDAFLKDVTKEVKQALTAAADNGDPKP